MLITLGNLNLKTKQNEFKITNIASYFLIFSSCFLAYFFNSCQKEMLNFNIYFSALIKDTVLQAFNLEDKKTCRSLKDIQQSPTINKGSLTRSLTGLRSHKDLGRVSISLHDPWRSWRDLLRYWHQNKGSNRVFKDLDYPQIWQRKILKDPSQKIFFKKIVCKGKGFTHK